MMTIQLSTKWYLWYLYVLYGISINLRVNTNCNSINYWTKRTCGIYVNMNRLLLLTAAVIRLLAYQNPWLEKLSFSCRWRRWQFGLQQPGLFRAGFGGRWCLPALWASLTEQNRPQPVAPQTSPSRSCWCRTCRRRRRRWCQSGRWWRRSRRRWCRRSWRSCHGSA